MFFTILYMSRGSHPSGLNPFSNFFVNALVLLHHVTPLFGVLVGNARDQSKHSPSGLKIPATVSCRAGSGQAENVVLMVRREDRVLFVSSETFGRTNKKHERLEELYHRSPAHRQE